jgi:hypothetical protein
VEEEDGPLLFGAEAPPPPTPLPAPPGIEEGGSARNVGGAAVNGFGAAAALAPGAALIGAGFIGKFGNPFPGRGALVAAIADSC